MIDSIGKKIKVVQEIANAIKLNNLEYFVEILDIHLTNTFDAGGISTAQRYIKMIGRASDCISNPLSVNTLSFLPNKDSNSKRNYQFEHQISLGNMTLCHKYRHSLLLEFFITFIMIPHPMSFNIGFIYYI